MKYIITLIAVLSFVFVNGQKTYVPDDNFEAYLESNGSGDGIANNDSVTTANISGELYLDFSFNGSISDLTGIEDFTSLESLKCPDNQLTSLDVSQNTALTTLWCYNNQLTSLDVSGATALHELRCGRNQLTSLDVSNNTALDYLYCSHSLITSLDLSNNAALTYLVCSDNQLTSLDVSQQYLNYLKCSDNQLTCLNVKNGNNVNLTGLFFYANNNPNLTCIEVDDAAWSTANWTVGAGNIDATASFSTNCNNACSSTGIQEHYSSLNLYPNPFTTSTTIELPNNDSHTLSICDLVGNLVRTESVSGEKIEIDRGTLTKGIYFIELRSEKETLKGKIVVE